MAKPSLHLIAALRATALRLQTAQTYQWGHMGLCNCGFLAQEVTRLTKAEIHQRAMVSHGDWSEQLNDYCPTSSMPLDDVISQLIAFGFDTDDLKHLERLSDTSILKGLPDHDHLAYNVKGDVIRYIKAWANLLEDRLLNDISIPGLACGRPLHIESPRTNFPGQEEPEESTAAVSLPEDI
jgi:hypothetical protein